VTKAELINEFEKNIEHARTVYNRSEQVQMQMREAIATMEEQLRKFNESK
jgi:hypothetical protein